MPKLPINYNKTLMYKLVCNDLNVPDVYVGNTTSFVDKQAMHKRACNNPSSKAYDSNMYTTIRAHGGWENWTMVVIERFPCGNRQEARNRLQAYNIEHKRKKQK